VSEADLFRIESRLKGINAFAPIMRTEKAQVSVDSVLNIKAFDLKKTLDMDPEFLNTDGEHEHDNSVSSISIIQPGNVDLELVQKWVGQLLQEKGAQIYRMKGVLSISNADEKFVYQAVHMLFRGNFDDKWEAGEPRESKLVFIGKNLDEKELRDGFNACIDTPEVLEKRIKTLRFAMGTKVECKTGGGWVKGEVVAHMYRDEFMPPGMVAPYQVKLDSGELIWAPEDVNNLIRKA